MSVIDKANEIDAKYDKLKAEIEAKKLTEGYTQEDKDNEIAEIEAKEITDEYTKRQEIKEFLQETKLKYPDLQKNLNSALLHYFEETAE